MHGVSATIPYTLCGLNREAIATGQVTLLFEDYRRMPGQYDAVMSTGFFEHVGSEFWIEHFRKVKQYAPAGRRLHGIQTMLVNSFDRKEARARKTFITKYIFPGGEFPQSAWQLYRGCRTGLASSATNTWRSGRTTQREIHGRGVDQLPQEIWSM